MKKILIGIFTCFLFTQSVFASEWYEVIYKDYVKIENISNNYVFYWEKKLNNKDIPRVKNKIVSFSMVYEMENCSGAGGTSILALYNYGVDGKVLNCYTSPYYNNPTFIEANPIIPQSYGEAIHQYVCSPQGSLLDGYKVNGR